MHSEKISVVIPAPKQNVIDYVANIDNFPRWATEFCHELRRVNDHYKVVSPFGELYLRIQANQDRGEINFFATPEIDGDDYLPTRVVNHTGWACEYIVDYRPKSVTSDAQFLQQCDSLRRELNNIKTYFESQP